MSEKKDLTPELLKKSIEIIREIQRDIKISLEKNRVSAIEEIFRRWKVRSNITHPFDLTAEARASSMLWRSRVGKNIVVYGEESLRDHNLDLSKEKNVVALLDMVDGSDLLVLDLSNWCSAIVFFQPDPDKPKILLSLVGDSFGRIYYAARNEKGAYVIPPNKGIEKRISISPSTTKKLKDAKVCFYGQKSKNFLPILKHKKFITALESMGRLYNLGGNPMMVKVAEGTIDAVFELVGQSPHDVVAGAYIAKKAGAILLDLTGKPVELEKSLLQPAKNKLVYVLASEKQLYNSIIGNLQ
jgi:fructose-1,6-bisphosphatase/inositol monophosphatase family enzyme